MDKTELGTWGNVMGSESYLREPESIDDLREIIESVGNSGGIARGSGMSYGDQPMNSDGDVIQPLFREGNIENPNSNGIITVPSSITFAELLERVVPLGWFMPVVPGTSFVTIGGAIAADIHGKNHYRKSSIASHIKSMTLMLADGETVRCSETEEASIFWATVGGLGLTGIVIEATIQLSRIRSSKVQVSRKSFGNFSDLFEAMKSQVNRSEYSVAWLDLISKNNFGRGILETANHVTSNPHPEFSYRAKPTLPLPNHLADTFLRRSTVKAYNSLRFLSAGKTETIRKTELSTFMHPLDKVRNWNRLYGKSGIIQWQIAVPEVSEHTLFDVIDSIGKAKVPAFLVVLKKLGPSNQAPLSFPMQGWTLAVDFPANHKSIYRFLDALDQELIKAGGRIYLAKDARLDAELIPKMYPALDEWKSIRQNIDPDGRWQSDFSRRLSL